MLATLQMPVHVLYRHRGIVNQYPHGQRKPPQRHDIQRLSGCCQRDDRREHGQRNRYRNDQRGTPAPEEEQYHQPGERGSDHALADDAIHRRLDEYRLITDHLEDKPGRRARHHAWQQRLDVVDDVQRGGAAVFLYRGQHRVPPVYPHHVLLRRISVAHMRHVAQQDSHAIDRLDRQVVQFIQHVRAGIEFYVVLVTPHLFGAGRDDQVLRQDRGSHVLRRQPLGAQGLHVQIHLNLPVFASIGRRNGSTHLGQYRSNKIVRKIEQLVVEQRVA